MAKAVISAQGLGVGHDQTLVVGQLDLDLEAGQTLALIGGNGSGKTTLLRTLGGLLPPLAGRLEVLGEDPRRVGPRLAWLGQSQTTNPLLPLAARDVVRMARYPGLGLWRRLSAADEAAVDEALAYFEVDLWARRPIVELSGGQRQRVFLAYVRARQAELVLLDEPLSNLDARGMALFTRSLDDCRQRGVSVVVATHNHEDAAACDRALALDLGGWTFGAGATIVADLPSAH